MGAAEALGGPLKVGVEHTLGIGVQLGVPHPQNRPSFVRKKAIAPNIAIAIRVLAAVKFDHQSSLPAGEVDSVRSDRQLAGELRPKPKDHVPQRKLMPGSVRAQRPGTLRLIEWNAPAHSLNLTPGALRAPTPNPSLPGRGVSWPIARDGWKADVSPL